jgi:autotransporter-associated beta strand protein
MKNPFLVAGCVLAFTTPLTFADTTWISTVTPIWGTAGNWNNGVPSGAGFAIFSDPAGALIHSIDLGAATVSTRGLQFGYFGNTSASGFTIFSSVTPVPISVYAQVSGSTVINNDVNTATINVPLKMYSTTGLQGSSAAQTWSALGGDLLFSGTYPGQASAAVDNSGATLTLDGAHNITVGVTGGRGDIVGTGGLVKNGSGNLTLGGTRTNTFSGGFTLNAGMAIGGKTNAFGTGAVTLKGGTTLKTGGFDQTLGALTISGGTITIDFGAVSSTQTLSFADSHLLSWGTGNTITLANWNPTVEKIRFGTSASGLTSAQLADFVYNGVAVAQSLDAQGFVVVPEPSTLALACLGGLGLALRAFARRRHA